MKKILKVVMLCCITTVIGILIGSGSKKLINTIFSNTNSSSQSVVENYLMAVYSKDEKTMKKCLSPDLNDVYRLEYFSEKGSVMAKDFLNEYYKYLQLKGDTTQNLNKKEKESHKKMLKKVKNNKLVEVYVDSIINNEQGTKENLSNEIKDLNIQVKLIGEENQYLSQEDGDPNYMNMKFNITKKVNGQVNSYEKFVAIQKKEDKYYIVDIPTDLY